MALWSTSLDPKESLSTEFSFCKGLYEVIDLKSFILLMFKETNGENSTSLFLTYWNFDHNSVDFFSLLLKMEV